MNDRITAKINAAALAALGGVLLVGLWLAKDTASVMVAIGMCSIALFAGWRLRERLFALHAIAYFGLAAVLAILVPLAGNELRGANRWLLPGEPLQLRGGLWVALLYAAGLACMGRDRVVDQRVTLVAALGAFVAILVGLGAMPDIYSAFMLFAAALLVVWHRPHGARRAVSWAVGLCLAALAFLIVSAPYRLGRLGNGLQQAWLSPESDPTGRGWAAMQTRAALEKAEWIGAGIRSELPARLEWYGVTEMATQFGLVAAVVATVALAIFCVVLLKRAMALRSSGTAGGFWIASTSLFSLATLFGVAPAYGLLPYMGHWGVPFVSTGDICWLGAFLAGALLLPATKTGNALEQGADQQAVG